MTATRRPYTDNDLPRLQAVIAAWTHEAGECGYIHPGEVPHRIYQDLAGKGDLGDLVHVWEDGEGIAGFAISCRFDTSFDVYAGPSLRGTSAESEMLSAAYETTRARAAADTKINIDVYACDTRRIELLEALGFEQHRVWDFINEVPLTSPIPEPELPAGFSIRTARMDDSEQLAVARNSAFDSDWTGESLRTAVMNKPGYQPINETVIVTNDGRVAAFTVCTVDDLNGVAHFEPVGTHRDFHRRGLARAMMQHILLRLKAQWVGRATVNHAADNEPALKLYCSLGFEKKFETLGYQR